MSIHNEIESSISVTNNVPLKDISMERVRVEEFGESNI